MRNSAALKQLRLIASRGLPSHQSIPLMLAELERMIPCCFANFFWLDAQGNPVDSYMPVIVPAAMDAFIGQYATLLRDPREPTLDKYVASGLDVGARAMTDRADFVDTIVFNDVFRVLGVADGLDLTIHDQHGARGIVFLNRDIRGGAWKADEIALLRSTAPHFLAALDASPVGPATAQSAVPESSAYLVVDRQGSIELAAGDAAMLIAQFLDLAIAPGFLFQPLVERLPVPLMRIVDRLLLISAGREAGPAQETRQTRWGEIMVRAYPAEAASEKRPDRIVLVLERRLPHSLIIARNVGRLPLAPRERQIAHDIATGKSVDAVARDLGLSRATVKSYLKAIYSSVGATSRDHLTRLIADA